VRKERKSGNVDRDLFLFFSFLVLLSVYVKQRLPNINSLCFCLFLKDGKIEGSKETGIGLSDRFIGLSSAAQPSPTPYSIPRCHLGGGDD